MTNDKLQTTNYSLRCGGYAIIASAVLLMSVSMIIVSGIAFYALKERGNTRNLTESKQSYFLSEAGTEDLTYRITKGLTYDNNENVVLNGLSSSASVAVNVDGNLEVTGESDIDSVMRKVKTTLQSGSGALFNYGVQVGTGGIDLDNSSSVRGNVYSNGTIVGSNSDVYGDIVSAGASGSVNNVNAVGGDIYAHSITNSDATNVSGNGGDVYYYTNVAGTNAVVYYPNSPDQPPSVFPITDEKIAEWETAAAGVAVISSSDPQCSGGEYEINSNITLGPVKIECDIEIEDDVTLTVAGTIWVTGKVEFKKPTIRAAVSLGNKSVAIIADKPSNRTTSSKFEVTNSTDFHGSGTPGSYIMLVSMNNSAEGGGAEKAMDITQSVTGDLLTYAPHGQIYIAQSVTLKEVTGYKIVLRNSSQVVYETGLANLIFDTGPGGGYEIEKWNEI